MSTVFISSNYRDAKCEYYASDYKDLIDFIAILKKEGIDPKFIAWDKNLVIWLERGVYGLTYT